MVNMIYQIPFLILYISLFLFMAIYLLSRFNKPAVLDNNGVTPDGHSVFKWLRDDTVFLCFLILAIIKFVYLAEKIIDIPIGGGSLYIYRSTLLAKGHLPPAEYGPLYAVWYYLLSFFEPDKIRLFFLNYRVLIFTVVIAVYVYLRRLKVVPFVAFVGSFLFLISGIWQKMDKFVTHFALLILLMFLILSTFLKTREGRHCIVGLGFLLASFARPEYFLSFIIFGVFFILSTVWRLKTRVIALKTALAKMFMFLVFSYLAIHIFGNPLSGDRSWVAFSEQFSVNYIQFNKLHIDAWSNSSSIIQKVFPSANTVAECMFSNSQAFLQHLLCNAGGYLRYSAEMILLDFQWPIARIIEDIIRCAEILFFIVVIIYLIKKIAYLRETQKPDNTGGLILIFWILVLPVFLSCIIIFTKEYYLIIQIAMIFILFSYLVSRTIVISANKKHMKLPALLLSGFLILVLTPNLANGWDIMFYNNRVIRKGQPMLRNIEFIRSLNIREKVNMVVAWPGYFIYLGKNYKELSIYNKKVPFTAFMETSGINMILFDDRLCSSARFINDKEFDRFLDDCSFYGFVKLDIPGTKNNLFVRCDLFNSATMPLDQNTPKR